MRIEFTVNDLPPMKDGANSMWCRQPGIGRLITLRRAAVAAFAEGDAQPFEVPVRLTLEVRGVVALGRAGGDLDNFITGVLDGLQAAAPGTPWEKLDEWKEAEEAIQPGRDVGFKDDALVVEVVARKVRWATGDEASYTVMLEAVEGW